MKINIGTFLTKRALITPNREGLVCESVRRTFSELNARANRLAHAMQALGIGHGDRVGMLALNEPEYYDLYFGLAKIGAILVPVNYRLAAPEMQYILSDSGVSVLIFSQEYLEIVDSSRSDLSVKEYITIADSPPDWAKSYESVIMEHPYTEPVIIGGDDDTLTILYTSGTTGQPKGAELTHRNYFWTSINMLTTFGETGENFLIALPLFHIGALAGPPHFVHTGKKAVLLRSFNPQRFLELLQEEKIHGFGSVPALLSFLKLVPNFEKYDWSSVRIILVYAAPVPVNLINEYAKANIEIRQLYGLTECTGPGSVIDPENAVIKAGSCGLPFFHVDIRLVDSQGVDVQSGEMGEVIMKGPGIMKGYWNRPKETSETIKDQWLHTGDIAQMDDDGFLYIRDRKKDMIISGAENIYPAEIENSLLANPKIQDVAVIGFPDEKWGEAVKAIVVMKEGEELTEEELIQWCDGKIGKYKIPKKVEFTDNIPRTLTGKILKRELRDQYN